MTNGGADTVEFLHARAKGGGLDFGEYYAKLLKKFCESNDGKRITITLVAGEVQTTESQGCFHGPILNAFCKATGDTDRVKLKGMLKEMFLSVPDGNGGTLVRRTRDLTEGQYKKFNRQCREFLEIEQFKNEDDFWDYMSKKYSV